MGPASPTAGGDSILDYGLLRGSLHLEMNVDWHVFFRPHGLVFAALDVGNMANIYPQPTHFPDLGGVEAGHVPVRVSSVCVQDTVGSAAIDILSGRF